MENLPPKDVRETSDFSPASLPANGNLECELLVFGRENAWNNTETIHLFDTMKPDILIDTETWLSDTIKDNEMSIDIR